MISPIVVVAGLALWLDARVMGHKTFLITGTDTGVGKTVLACLLARHWRETGLQVAALKPVCAGGRQDARALRRAAGAGLSLDDINPWHFRAPLAPRWAARLERKRVLLSSVVSHVRRLRHRFDLTLVEGAGGLLSPLGDNFNTRDLVVALRATPLVVCPNRLGAVNQALLVLQALPAGARRKAVVILVNPPRSNAASRTNPALLQEYLHRDRVHIMPWLANGQPRASLQFVLDALTRTLLR